MSFYWCLQLLRLLVASASAKMACQPKSDVSCVSLLFVDAFVKSFSALVLHFLQDAFSTFPVSYPPSIQSTTTLHQEKFISKPEK